MPMSNTSYIRLDRKILDWEWYGNINTCRVFIHMLLKAYWKDKKIEGNVIPRGSFPSSYGRLAEETQLTVDEVRTAVKHLISTKEITKHATSKYTVFTVNNYDAYQIIPSSFPNNSQTIPERFPTIEEKKEGNIKEDTNVSKKKFVPPSVDEVRAYCAERNNGIDPQSFVDFYESKGWMVGKNHMRDWKAAVRTWERNRTKPPNSKKGSFNSFAQNDYDFAALEEELRSN